MIQDFKPRLEQNNPSALRRHRHKLMVIGLSVVGSALLLQFAADPTDTTAAVPEPAPRVQVASLALPVPGEPAIPSDAAPAEAAPASPVQLVSLSVPAAEDTVSVDTAVDAIAVPHLDAEPADDADAAAPEISAADIPDTEEPASAGRWVDYRIQSGDNLARIFKDQGLSAQLLHSITHSSDEAAGLARIKPGQTLRFQFDDHHQLLALEHVLSPIRKLRIQAEDDGFTAKEVRKDLEVRVAEASGTISDSLFVDGQAAGLSDAQIMELANIFGWDIDFALELRKGDRFNLVYEEQYLDGKKYRNGAILAAEFINRGTSFRAIRFEDEDGNAAYYDTDGSSKRRAFIRTPVKFARISSGFTTRRWHPVLQKWRSHKGVDYAAPTGTPIRATGSGKIVFRGWKGGYGNAVIIQHGGKYTTLYGHMSRFAAKEKVGSRVKQGQIIGYVGQTGLATGPHLHYEFRVNGVHRNPLTVKLPKSLPLPKAQLAAFRRASAPLLAKLDALAPPTMVASADANTTR